MIRSLKRASRAFQEKYLQLMNLGMAVPLQDAGGLVFPLGIPFAGYRLEEWQFLRYRAMLDQEILSSGVEREIQFVALAASALMGVAICSGIGGFYYLLYDDRYLSMARHFILYWLPVILMSPRVFGLSYSYFLAARIRRKFLQRFPDAPRAPRFSNLVQRLHGFFAVQPLNPLPAFFRLIIFGMPGGLLLFNGLRDGFYAWSLFGLLLLSTALVNAWLLIVYIRFRLVHGRAPTLEDLKPV